MFTELVSIPTDGAPLDGLYYSPPNRRPRGGVLLMHGNQMNFYVGPLRFLPPYLVDMGLACLAFNRRGHDTLGTKDSRNPVGGAFQSNAEGLADNEYANDFLVRRGFSEPIVIGHSNGGMLAAQFAARHSETKALVLLSAHAGGTVGLGSSPFLGQDRHEEFLQTAEKMVAEGRGRALMLVPGWWHVISAESYVDRHYNTPDTVAAAPHIRCPVLYVRGDTESPVIYPTERFQAACQAPCEVRIVEACDHFYVGCEQVIAEIVTGWLHRMVNDVPQPA